jgi:hypothetical protein
MRGSDDWLDLREQSGPYCDILSKFYSTHRYGTQNLVVRHTGMKREGDEGW